MNFRQNRRRGLLSIFVLVYLNVVASATSGPSISKVQGLVADRLQCYSPAADPLPVRPPRLDAGNDWLVFDDFKQAELSPDYHLHYGGGSYGLANTGSYAKSALVYELRQDAVLVQEQDAINLTADSLGRPFTPSLLLERHWDGEDWTFDTRVNYGSVGSCNGCNIYFWIALQGLSQRNSGSVRVSRFFTGDPQKPGNLTAAIFEKDGSQVSSIEIPLNSRDVYFLRVKRNGNSVELFVSEDGNSFRAVAAHSFESNLGNGHQWLIVNSLAFMGGCGYAAFNYFTVQSHTKAVEAIAGSTPQRWTMHGTRDQYLELTAADIKNALRNNQDIDVRFATVKGDLDLEDVKTSTIQSQIVFRDSRFENMVRGSYLIFTKDVIFAACEMEQPIQLYNSIFKSRVNFSGSTFRSTPASVIYPLLFSNNDFELGADFTEVTFQAKPTFRMSRFHKPASFWSANFTAGGDLSGTKFLSGVTFVDFSFSNADAAGSGPDMLFFNGVFCGRTLFVSTFSRPNPILGHEISFQGAQINELVFSGGTPEIESVVGQEGPPVWIVPSGLSLREARVGAILIKDIVFISRTVPVDFQGMSFGPIEACALTAGGSEAKDKIIKFYDVEFADLRMSNWPVTRVLTDARSAARIVSALDASDPALSRMASFDLAATSDYYDRWRRIGGAERKSYTDYSGYKAEMLLLRIFWIISGYGTSFWRTMVTGLVLVTIFACAFTIFDHGKGHLIRIEKSLELKTRLSETPVQSLGEIPKDIDSQLFLFPHHQSRRTASRLDKWVSSVAIAGLFSLNTVLKIGFGNIRVRPSDSAPRGLLRTAWLAWVIGYGWYLLLIYTISVIPLLKGLVK